TLTAFHWLMEPLLRAVLVPLGLRGLPWLLLALGAWLLAGDGNKGSGNEGRGSNGDGGQAG
ncbi:MAG: hypothetical protein VKM34_09300, partial [Cyanobacteriota bacterium]|nr:hypothetical protein [Cyanobacteriota bacterium]